jgi:K+-sensing histidine kinase KdpD
MNTDAGMIGRTGLEFFGKMCASISHDLKNVLAVVNENAGLLEDLCLMADRGKRIDTARLKRLAVDVKAQVRHGDGIISGMNRFAHSVDSTAVRWDLLEAMELLAALSLRFVSMQGLAFKVSRPSDRAAVTTLPFLLLNLLWLCLEHAMTLAGDGRTVELTAERTADGACFRFCNLQGLKSGPAVPFPNEAARCLCDALNAEISKNVPANEVVVKIIDMQE